MRGLTILRTDRSGSKEPNDGEVMVEYKKRGNFLINASDVTGPVDSEEPVFRSSIQNFGYNKKEPDVLRKSNFILRSSISKKDFDRLK